MKIGKWTVQIEGWSLVFKRAYEYDPSYGGFTNAAVDLNKHYSAEDVKKWQDELRGHTGGL